MKRILIGVGIAVMVASVVLVQGRNHAAGHGTADTLEDVKRAIEKGNAQWSEGWAKGDAAMVAAIFADDGVQLADDGKIIRDRSRSWSGKRRRCTAPTRALR